jgi:epoxyqueuosine reductase
MLTRLAAEARRLGFDLVGIASVRPAADAERYETWLRKGYHGEMAYLARPDAIARRRDLSLILPQAQSVIAVGINYYTSPPSPEIWDDRSRGLIASYAWGNDYHDVLTPRLHQLATSVQAEYRACVDTSPVLERELATRARMGFVGKNTNLIHPHLGSWLFLGELLVSVELSAEDASPDPRAHNDGCGSCTRCLDACPTKALVAPYLLDARRCISYLTVELKGAIPLALRPLVGNRILGCDVCQEVCPWNRRFARPTAEPAFQPRPDAVAPRLLELIALDEDGFRQRFAHSPVKRAKRRGLLRNVATALGNWGDAAAVPALTGALHDPEPLIRGHAAWALGRIATDTAGHALEQALAAENDESVREELYLAQN